MMLNDPKMMVSNNGKGAVVRFFSDFPLFGLNFFIGMFGSELRDRQLCTSSRTSSTPTNWAWRLGDRVHVASTV
ncbi:hypothetical protein AN958_08040 [Leucoagaricus sp. SymC.cos]|nr:hypothetical protein AN958_08040 [Leucoagaricus sp. SymC.cos]